MGTGKQLGSGMGSDMEATVPLDAAERAPLPLVAAPPARIDRYVLLCEQGRGAMGVVYRAHDPRLDRQVAIKLFGSQRRKDKAWRTRVAREARTLAKLSHPNVVAVFDVGTHREPGLTGSEQLFIAMEYVRGTTVGEWLSTARPAWHEIVAAFVDAAQGLAAAHRVGLIHRDVKPHNILRCDDGVCKMSDFGLAREQTSSSDPSIELDRGLPSIDSQEITRLGDVMGTPAFMPPEQHMGRELDGRSDQYAFCVALYQALAGRRPFEGKDSRRLLEAKLSDRPAPISDVPRVVSDAVLRGLAPQRQDRFATMDGLITHLERGFVARRRWPYLLSLPVVTAAALAWIDRDEANDACEVVAESSTELWNDAARDEVQTAMLATGVPYAAASWKRVDTAVQQWVVQWAELRAQGCEQGRTPDAAASVRSDRVLACLDRHAAEVSAWIDLLAHADARTVETAVNVATELPRSERCLTADSDAEAAPPGRKAAVQDVRSRLAAVRALERAGDIAEALPVARIVLSDARRVDHDPLIAEASALTGRLLRRGDEFEEARLRLEEAYFLFRGLGLQAQAAQCAADLASVTGYYLARFDEGVQWGRTAQSLAANADDPRVQASVGNELGVVYLRARKDEEARHVFDEELTKAEAHAGPEHLRLAPLVTNLGLALDNLGDLKGARRAFERALEIRRHHLGEAHPDVAGSRVNLGLVLAKIGEYESARRHYEAALQILEPLQSHRADLASTLLNVGMLAYAEGRFEDAVAQYERALEIRTELFGPEHPDVVACLNNIANALQQLGRHAEAEQRHQAVLLARQKRLGSDHVLVGYSLSNLANTVSAQGRHAEAVKLFEEARQIVEQAYEPDPPELALVLRGLAGALHERGEDDEALTVLAQAETLLDRSGALPDILAEVRMFMAGLVEDQDPDRARSLAQRAQRGITVHPGNAELRAEVEQFLARRG